jgi:hypothetical protein
MEVSVFLQAGVALFPGKNPGTHLVGGWMGHRAGLDVSEKIKPSGVRTPHRPVRRIVATPTTRSSVRCFSCKFHAYISRYSSTSLTV